MMGHSEKFLRILRVELEDLEGHLERLIELCEQREHCHEVSEHVCRANIAVFRNEQRALTHFRQIIDRVNPNEYPDLDALVAWLGETFAKELRIAGLSPAASFFTARKMQRVEQYVKHGCAA